MPQRDTDERWNRDQEQKPGSPPRTAYEPDGGEGSARSPKTMTDPATGEQRSDAPAPSQSEADDGDA